MKEVSEMAAKDTINALVKRGITEEVATILAKEFKTISGITNAGVDAIVQAGLSKETAEMVMNALPRKPTKSKVAEPLNDGEDYGSRESTENSDVPPVKTKKSRAKSIAKEDITLHVSEEDLEVVKKKEVPKEEYYAERELTPSEKRLSDLCEQKQVDLPKMVVRDIADRIKDADIDDEICTKLLFRAQEMYNAHKMAQNESAGVMAAHSIGEPGTQMNLRTFHVAGDASVAVTRGLPRLIEIVDARREPSTPSMNIPLVGLAREDKAIAEHVASEIEITTLSNVAEIKTDITHMKIYIKFDSKKLDKLDLDLDTVLTQLRKIKAVRGQIAKADPSENMDGDLVISSDVENPTPFTKLLEMYDAIKNAQLKGVDGITRALVISTNGSYSIVTEGSNMKEVLNIEGVDKDHVMTNSILEIADVFGIEAARNAIIYEATSTLKDAGLDVDVRHIMLVADLMTNDGNVRAIGRNGVSGKKSSVLARAAFEITAAHLLHAAMVGETDKLEGVTENIIVGQPVTLGTGAIKLYYDPEKIKNLKEDIE